MNFVGKFTDFELFCFELYVMGFGISSGSKLCPAGCASCSALNGCLSCKPRLFFHLELDGMRQRGTCLSSCPRGHYGMRSPHINTCTRCKEDCSFCFSENFCTRCHPGHFLFQGKCESSCPNGLTPNTALRECTVHCEVGEWTEWGPCIRKRSMRAYRRGEVTRTRQVLRSPSVYGEPCPHVSETRRCIIKKRQSPKIFNLFLPISYRLIIKTQTFISNCKNVKVKAAVHQKLIKGMDGWKW
uniref:R-spondin 3 n=1 Tax=Lates calcarifer TaxID=8187 RepID=A0A4W6EMC9_LATCA